MTDRRRVIDWFYDAGLISEQYARMLARCALQHQQPCICHLRDLLRPDEPGKAPR